MHKITLLLVLLLAAASNTHACPDSRHAECLAAVMLADASGEEMMRFRESHEGDEPGSLSVRVTTFDGSPSTPGMWYERPRRELDDGLQQYGSDLPVAPFDRRR